MRAPRSPAQPKTTRLPNKARRLPQTKTPRSLVWAIPAAPELNEANMQSLTEATHAGNPALLASKPLRRALRLQAKSPAAPGARTLRCRQTKPSPRRPLLRILSSSCQEFRACALTVKLNGRAEAPDSRRGRTIFASARGAQPPAHHGPFQRWLEDALNKPTVRARNLQRKPKLTDATNPDRPAEAQPRQSAATGAGLACWPHRLPVRAQAEAFSEGSWPSCVESGSRLPGGFLPRPLTVKLRGRTTTPT